MVFRLQRCRALGLTGKWPFQGHVRKCSDKGIKAEQASNRGNGMPEICNFLIAALGGVSLLHLMRQRDAPALIAKPIAETRATRVRPASKTSASFRISEFNEVRNGGFSA